MTSLANLPNFLAYFGASVVLLAAFLGAVHADHAAARMGADHARATPPWRSAWRAATLALRCRSPPPIVHSANLPDMAVWAAVALVLQLSALRRCACCAAT